MRQDIINIIATLALAGIFAIIAELLALKKQSILATVHSLVQHAEQTVQGSSMGAEKKALVVAQLEAMGIRMTAWLDAEIDDIVAELNDKKAWYATLAVTAGTGRQ